MERKLNLGQLSATGASSWLGAFPLKEQGFHPVAEQCAMGPLRQSWIGGPQEKQIQQNVDP